MRSTLSFLKVYTLLICIQFISAAAFAQDPAQYGTPYTGVPDVPDAIIYQVNMRSFSSTRDFQGVIARLDNIKALGVNVIYLMPFYPVGTEKAFNSPYCIKDLYSVAAEFGTLDDLRELVDLAHEKEMAVIIDWVPNQTAWDHPWTTDHKDWYLQDADGNIIQFNDYSDVAALDFSNTDMRAEMINAMRYWVFTANIDGFRCDFADNPPIDFWEEAITSLRGITTHKLLLLAEGARSTNYSAGFDMNFGFNFYYASIKPIYEEGKSATIINSSNNVESAGATGDQQVARYLTNHDAYGGEGSPYTIFGGRNGTLSAFVVASFMKGVPFIYNGMEVGNTVAMPFPFTSSYVNWTEDVSITTEMTKLLSIRSNSEAIKRGSLLTYSTADVSAFKKDYETERIFVVANLRNAAKTFTLPDVIANTSMYDEVSNSTVALETNISLGAYEYKIYSATITTPVDEVELLPSRSSAIYPNTINDGIVNILLANNYTHAKIEVFDIQGRKEYTTDLSEEKSTIDLSGLYKGLYVINIYSDDQIDSHKILIQ